MNGIIDLRRALEELSREDGTRWLPTTGKKALPEPHHASMLILDSPPPEL